VIPRAGSDRRNRGVWPTSCVATVRGSGRLAGRVTLEASLAGQARPRVLDLSSHDLLQLPERGERVNLSLRGYRVFPAAR